MSETKITFGHAVKPDMNLLASYIDKIKPNALSNGGPMSRELTDRLTSYLGLSDDRELILCSSGHTALMAAYAISGIDTLSIPSFTFESTRNAATLQDIKVQLCDVSLQDGCIPSEKVRYIASQGVVAVCALSNIPDLDTLEHECRVHNKRFIIDGAASFGTNGIYNYGDFFCLSFHGTKTFPLGEGGAVICRKSDAEWVRSFINFGFDNDRNPIMVGMNAKISEYTCAIGLAVFDRVLEEIEYKLNLAHLFRKELADVTLCSSVIDTVHQSFPIVMRDVASARAARAALTEAGIEYKQYYKPMSNLVNAKSLYQRNICLPCHSGVDKKAAHQIIEIVKRNI